MLRGDLIETYRIMKGIDRVDVGVISGKKTERALCSYLRWENCGRHGGAAVEWLPYSECSAGDSGSILTTGAVCTEFVSSPHDLRGFSPRSSVSSHTPKTYRYVG